MAEVPNASPPAGLFYVDSQNEPLFTHASIVEDFKKSLFLYTYIMRR